MAMDAAAREQLAAQLEEQLEEFVSELQKGSSGYQDGWPEDRWEEEMDKHPFFMKQAPDLSSGELPPLLEGLARLKFDPDNNTPVELASNYREDGNFYFKNKNYRLSIVSYTEGIKINCDDDKLNAVLYNNRSLGHYLLENYRSSLNDCQKALSYDPEYRKPKLRAAHCAFKLLEFNLCVKFCDDILSLVTDPVAEKLKKESVKIINEMTEKADNQNKVLEAMKLKGIKMYNPVEDEDMDLDLFLSSMPSIEKPAHMAADGKEIIWPVIILYPQYNIYDYYQDFVESNTIVDLMQEVLSEPSEWDENLQYNPDTIDVYYIGHTMSDLYQVDTKKTLFEIMREKKYYLRRLSPIFVVKPKS